MYEGIQLEVISTTRFDENSDLSTAYIGRIDTTRASNTIGRLLGGTECKILLDTRASKSFMSKSNYL